jgi:hypothetical protein
METHYTDLEARQFVALRDVRIDLEFLLHHLCSSAQDRPITDRVLTVQEISEIYNTAWSSDHLREFLRRNDLLNEQAFVETVQRLDRIKRDPQGRHHPSPRHLFFRNACFYLTLFIATTGVFSLFYFL